LLLLLFWEAFPAAFCTECDYGQEISFACQFSISCNFFVAVFLFLWLTKCIFDINCGRWKVIFGEDEDERFSEDSSDMWVVVGV